MMTSYDTNAQVGHLTSWKNMVARVNVFMLEFQKELSIFS